MRSLLGLACLLPAWLGAGCTVVGPDFQPPRIESPVQWQHWHGGDPTLAADADAAAALAGWRAIADPTLEELLARADTANADLLTAALRLAQSRVQRGLAQAAGGPQVGASASATRQRQSEHGASTRLLDALGSGNPEQLRRFLAEPHAVYDAALDLSWEVDFWGRVRRSVEVADAGIERDAALLRQARLAVRADLVNAYAQVRGTGQQLQLLRAQVAAAQDTLALTGARVAGGLAAEADRARQRTALAELQAREAPLLRTQAQVLNRIALLLGERPGTVQQLLAQAPGELRPPPALALGLPGQLVARRPDVQAAQARLQQATASIGVAVADLYPRLSLGGSFGLESVGTERFGEWGSRRWRIGPSLSMPVFDLGRRRGTVTLRELEQQEAAVAFQQAVLRAWHEVDDAVAAYQAERRRGAGLQARLEATRDTWQLARQRHDGGLTDALPVLEAQRSLLQAESEWVEHRTRLAVEWIGLARALAVE
jgi:NodT family efflux transporter outer membrane factor (OMF) lipoprotein